MSARSQLSAVRALFRRGVRSDVGRHGGMVLIATVGVNVANFMFYSLAGRTVDVAGYGALMSLVSLALIVTAPAVVAQNTLAKLVADLDAAGDPDVVSRVARNALGGALLVASALFVAAIVLNGPLSHLVHVSDPLLIPLTALATAATIIVPVQRGIFQGANRFTDLSGSMLLEAFMRIATIVPLARLAGARGGLIAFSLSMLVPLVVFGMRSLRVWPPGTPGRPLDVRRFSRAVIETGTGFLAVTVMLSFDVVLVRHYFDAYNAGLYGAAAVVGRAIFTGAAFIPMVLIPKIVARRATRGSVRPIAILGIGVTAIVGSIGIGIVALAPQRVVTLVNGPAYAPAAPYLLPYACAVSLLAGANVAAAVRVGLHRFGHVKPLVAIAVAEIVIVALHHATIGDVLWTIVGGHAMALIILIGFAVLERSSENETTVALAPSLRKL